MNHQQLLEQFFEERPWLVVDANRSFLLSAAGSPVTLQGLRQAADRLGSQLVTAPEFESAWREFITRRPEFNMLANRNICFGSLNPYEEPSADVFCELADRENSPLAVNAATTAQRDEARELLSLIAEISQGKEKFPIYAPAYGTIRWVQSSSLKTESLASLREIAAAVQKTREKMSQSREDQRNEMRSHAEVVSDATPEVFLENPQTLGKEYTASQLKQLNKDQYRKLIFFPGGQARPGVADRITKILKGQA